MNPEKLIIQFNALIIRYVNEASIGYEEVTLGRKPTVQKVLLNVRFRWKADVGECLLNTESRRSDITFF